LPRVAAHQIGKVVKIADASHNISKAHLIEETDERNRLRSKYATALKFLEIDPMAAELPIHFFRTSTFIGWDELANSTNE